MTTIRYGSSSKQFCFRSNRPLTNDEIAYHAPSVLAAEPHVSRGEKYTFIPTIEVLDRLRLEGFQPFEVRQTKTRDKARLEFSKHLVRMRHADAITLNGVTPEIVLVNSHDGTSSYNLMSGFFRMVCSNGLIAGDITDNVRVRHSGSVVDDVIEGSFTVLDNVRQAALRIDAFKSIELSPGEQLAFANAALSLKYEQDSSPIQANSLLAARRYEDRPDDLWTVFNRVQENMIRGGLRGRSTTGRRIRTREVTGVNEDVRLNRSLWALASSMAEIKNGYSMKEAA